MARSWAPTFTLTKSKEFRETSNANHPHRRLRSRIGFLGLGESSCRRRPVCRYADRVDHQHDRVVWHPSEAVKPELAKGRASPGLSLVGQSDGRLVRRGLSSRDHQALTAFQSNGGSQGEGDELFRCAHCSWLQREGVEQNGKSFFDDAADQRRDRRAYHLPRDARRLTRNAADLRTNGRHGITKTVVS